MNYKKVYTEAQILADPRVSGLSRENDLGRVSWWCYLKPGFQAYGNEQHTIHEKTLKEICNELNGGVQAWLTDPDLNTPITNG